MFQYAFYSYLKRRYKSSLIKADLSWFEWNSAHQGFELKKLFERDDNPAFDMEAASRLEVFKVSGQLPQKGRLERYVNRLARLFAGRHFDAMRLSESGRENDDMMRRLLDGIDEGRDYYITGYFDDEIYYRKNLKELRSAFSFDVSEKKIGKKNIELLRKIGSSESVSIHVRRGDYLNSGYTESFIKLTMDYYRSAVEIVSKRLKEPRYFLFSDDKDYIRREFDWLPNSEVVEGNDGNKSYIDMLLMSRCKCNITANSTFSEWAALLNDNEAATVVYPREYIKGHDSRIKTIEGWVRI